MQIKSVITAVELFLDVHDTRNMYILVSLFTSNLGR